MLRALGDKLGAAGFEFTELSELRNALAARTAAIAPQVQAKIAGRQDAKGLARIATVPIYRSDAVVRRAAALQAHPLNSGAGLGLNPQDAAALGVEHGSMVKISGAAGTATLPVVVTHDVPRGGAWIEAAYVETAALPAYGAELSISKA